MPAVARVGDRHQGVCNHGFPCCPHPVTGEIIAGSPKHFANGQAIARVGDAVSCTCPHCGTGVIETGSPKHNSLGQPIARMGDVVVYGAGQGFIISGSPDVFIGASSMSVAVMASKSAEEIASMTLAEILGM